MFPCSGTTRSPGRKRCCPMRERGCCSPTGTPKRIASSRWHVTVGCGSWTYGSGEPPGRGDGARATPDALACVMFTSGSTGRPKGVAITQGNLAGLAADRWWSEGGADRVLLHSPHAFDAFNLELWVPLLTGGEVVVAPPGRLDPAGLSRITAATGITGLWLTAGLFDAFATEDPACLAGLRQVWTGGDVVVPGGGARRAVRAAGTHRRQRLRAHRDHGVRDQVRRRGDAAGRRLGSHRYAAGRQAGAAARRRAATGTTRRGGRGVPRGCGGRARLPRPGGARPPSVSCPTRPARPAPASTARATWPAGTATAGWSSPDAPTGRSSSAATGSNPGRSTPRCWPSPACGRPRRSCARTGRECAGWSPTWPRRVTRRGCSSGVADRLPPYMVPSAVVAVDRLPLTRNGKLDRLALPAPEDGSTDVDRAPRTAVEHRLAELFGEVLGLESIPLDTGLLPARRRQHQGDPARRCGAAGRSGRQHPGRVPHAHRLRPGREPGERRRSRGTGSRWATRTTPRSR